MKPITITNPKSGIPVVFTDEQMLRNYLNNEIFSFKDSRLFKFQALIRTARVGQIPEILDSFKIHYEQA